MTPVAAAVASATIEISTSIRIPLPRLATSCPQGQVSKFTLHGSWLRSTRERYTHSGSCYSPRARLLQLCLDPLIRLFKTDAERLGRCPIERSFDQFIIRTSAANSRWSRYMFDPKPLSRNVHCRGSQLIDGDHFLRADV